MSKNKKAGRGRENQRAPNRDLATPQPQRSVIHAENTQGGRHRGRKSGAEFSLAKERIPHCGSPIQKHRLFEPRRTEEPWSDVIARKVHLPGDRGITRLIGADKSDRAQSMEKERITGCSQE